MKTIKNKIPDFQLYGSRGIMDSNQFFDIARIGQVNAQYRQHYSPHRHTHLHELIWVSKGKLSVRMDETKYNLLPNTLCMIHTGTVHESVATSQLEGFIIHFSSDFLLSAAGNSNAGKLNDFQVIGPVQIASARTCKRIGDIFIQINTEFDSIGPEREDFIRHYLNIILLEGQREADPADRPPLDRSAYQIIKHFKRLVEQRCSTMRRVSDYAELLNITPNYLNMLSKNSTGRTAGQFIRDQIILEAKRLLLYSEASVSEVAFALNYNDVSYFSRLFKKIVKISPSEFKKRYSPM